MTVHLRSRAAVEELNGLFTTLTPGTAQQLSGPAFDGPFLEELGLSLDRPLTCPATILYADKGFFRRVREIPESNASRGIRSPSPEEGAAMVAEEEGAALAEEEEPALLLRPALLRTAGMSHLETLAAEWSRQEDDDVPIAQVRWRHSAGSSGVPEEDQCRPEGPSLEPEVGRLAPERE